MVLENGQYVVIEDNIDDMIPSTKYLLFDKPPIAVARIGRYEDPIGNDGAYGYIELVRRRFKEYMKGNE